MLVCATASKASCLFISATGAGERRLANTARDKTAVIKEIDKIQKIVAELTTYENQVICLVSMGHVSTDPDDGA